GFSLEGGLSCGLFFPFAGELSSGGSGSLGFARLLLCLGGFAGLAGLGASGRLRLALGLALLHLGIVRPWLGLELVQDILPRLLGSLLAVGEAGFLESTHKRGLVVFIIDCETRGLAICALLSEPAA